MTFSFPDTFLPTAEHFDFRLRSQDLTSSPKFLVEYKEKRREIAARVRSPSVLARDPSWPLMIEQSASKGAVQRLQPEPSIQTKLFDMLVTLKISISPTSKVVRRSRCPSR